VAIWYILWPFGIFCGNFVYFVAICTKKNMATLLLFALLFVPSFRMKFFPPKNDFNDRSVDRKHSSRSLKKIIKFKFAANNFFAEKIEKK
jgi:hypothetical protein